MKREEGKAPQKASAEKTENLKSVAIEILKTMVLLERPYGPDYLIRILRGIESAYYKVPDPREFETFGALNKYSQDFLRLSLQHLVLNRLIAPRKPEFAVLEITDLGRDWLGKPRAIMVPRDGLRSTVHEVYLRRMLHAFRTTRAESDGIPTYKIFTSYTLDRLVIEKPDCLEALSVVPGMNPFRAELYGNGILSIILEHRDSFAEHRRAQLLAKVDHPKYVYVKRQLAQNRSVAEIAKLMGLTVTTIYRYMTDLADADQLNLKNWIESQVDAKTLHKGSDFFQRVKNPTLKAAFETLGLDYDTLKLCRMYVSRYSQQQDQLALPV